MFSQFLNLSIVLPYSGIPGSGCFSVSPAPTLAPPVTGWETTGGSSSAGRQGGTGEGGTLEAGSRQAVSLAGQEKSPGRGG